MSIKSIEIKNFNSIEYLKLNISELNAFVGKNGVGKSTIVNAIKYFYDNLIDINANNKNFDSTNMYKNKIEIVVEYDFSRIQRYARDSYYMKLYSMLGSSAFGSNVFTVKMEQGKGSHIQWNIDYSERYIIYNSHPIYFCNSRDISLTDWDDMWNVVGDLVNAKDANEISEEILLTLKATKFLKFNQYSDLFKKFLENNDLSIDNHSKKKKIISLLQLQLGGKSFISKNKRLDYYSDGTNSQNFILFLSYIAFEIARKRLKDVTVVLDEPELGLHPKMIDELMEKLVDYSQNVIFFIFSHSPRLVAYVLKNQGQLYNLSLEGDHTKVRKINKASEENEKLIITDREASYFFSDFLLFVEGVSEIELFNHKVLVSLFPILKRVDIISTNSNDHIIKMISPEHSNSAIPYLILVDLDKLITFKKTVNLSKYKFKINNLWYSPLSSQNVEESLKFNYSKIESKHYLNMKKKILSSEKKEYEVNGDLKLVLKFDLVFGWIKNFCLFNNVYTVRDTIEGTIINSNTNKYINKWRNLTYGEKKEMTNLLKKINIEERIVVNRLFFSGKTDILENYKKENFPVKFNTLNNTIKKNTYWISSFFNYYNEKILNQKQYAKDFDNVKKKQRFKDDFPELYGIIKSIEDRISDE
ncbi:retron Eco8 family effector endonuclease [Carnobacterium maltaromaticum]|uniref:retron Eco8 family effector endonuclease n=1 Tax=Carnobacterium maltaromaticum TaxID=2751 RepID=UPI0039B0654B